MAKTSVGQGELTKEGKLDPAAIDATVPKTEELVGALSTVKDPAHAAALAIVAGLRGIAQAVPELLSMLKRDDFGGRAAAWALGMLDADVEREILGAIASGGVLIRENGYWALAVRAARGVAPAGLADAIFQRIDEELARVKTGRVSVADRAIAVLAVLGDPRTEERVHTILNTDRSSDRVELNRILKRFESEKRDTELKRELTAPWPTVFKDHVYVPPAEEAAAAHAPPSPLAAATAPPPQKPAMASPMPGKQAAPAKPSIPPQAPAHAPAQPAPPAQAGGPIDWAAFEKSPEAGALAPHVRQFAPKVGGLLEQLSVRAVGVQLAELTGQELMALLVQVLPQSLPPQHVELALSPDALDAYEAVAKYLMRTGAAPHGAELVAGVQRVRQVIEQQMMGPG